MSDVHLEVLVEPFKENEPGTHVHAVVEALSAAGLDPVMGPFATSADGDIETVADAIRRAAMAGFDDGATVLQFRIEIVRG